MGNPVRRAPAAFVEDPTALMRRLVVDMGKTMEDAG
jgi:hypothetical protein